MARIQLKTALGFLSLPGNFGHPHPTGTNASTFARGARHPHPVGNTPGAQDAANPPQRQHSTQNSQVTPLPKQRQFSKRRQGELPKAM